MKKIMFNDKYGLTKAVLEGRKTMTRRAVPEKLLEAYYDYDDYVIAVAPRDIPCSREYEEEFFLRRSRFKPGEVVAVAQSYKDAGVDPSVEQEGSFQPTVGDSAGWNNKMFVQAWLMPNRIRITNVRVERLQDISDEDVYKEGFIKEAVNNGWWNYAYHYEAMLVYYDGLGRSKEIRSRNPREAYADLIDKVSGKGTWESNPWVFVYEFELVK